jgi:hypothetical protein
MNTGLWKLPDLCTPKARAQILGNAKPAFPQLPQASINCSPCFRTNLLLMFPDARAQDMVGSGKSLGSGLTARAQRRAPLSRRERSDAPERWMKDASER